MKVGELVEMNNDLRFCENLNKVLATSDDKKGIWNWLKNFGSLKVVKKCG